MPYLMNNSHKPGIPSIDEDGYWDADWGRATDLLINPMKYGYPSDAKYFPSSGHLRNKPKVIPNIFCQPWWFCNDEIKDVIEALEPGRHRFYPYTLRKSRKGETVAHLYIIHALEPIESIDVDRSPRADPQKYNNRFEIDQGHSDAKPSIEKEHYVVMTEDYPKDRHIWRDTRVDTINGIFISDHLHSIITQTPNKTVQFWRLLEPHELE